MIDLSAETCDYLNLRGDCNMSYNHSSRVVNEARHTPKYKHRDICVLGHTFRYKPKFDIAYIKTYLMQRLPRA